MLNTREQSFSGVGMQTSALSVDQLVAETRRGTGLTLELVEHLARMQAEGYSNEIQVDGQSWKIIIERTSLPS